MGKIEVKPNTKQDQILKIWYNEKEPPKNYIWGNPDGFYYIWEDDYWAAYDDLTEIKQKYHCNVVCDDKCNKQWCHMSCPCVDYITPEKLTDRLERFQRDILKYVLKTIKEKINGGTDESISALIEDLESRLSALENGSIELEGYATKQWVEDQNYLVAVDLNGLASQKWVNEQGFLKQHQDISGLATIEYVDGKTLDRDEFDALATDLGYIKNAEVTSRLSTLINRIGSLETELSNAKSDITALSNRIAVLEAIDHDQFITTGQGSSSETYDDTELTNRITALENATTDMATQTWVSDNFELKFTDLTSEQDPVAEAQSHDDDNRVYITEIETE